MFWTDDGNDGSDDGSDGGGDDDDCVDAGQKLLKGWRKDEV